MTLPMTLKDIAVFFLVMAVYSTPHFIAILTDKIGLAIAIYFGVLISAIMFDFLREKYVSKQ